MDDGVVLKPLVGNRIYQSWACLDETMKLVWGPEGVNVEKMAEEGHPSACQLLWGLQKAFDKLQVSLPEPKRIKAKYLMAEATLQRGCRSIPLKLLRELAGSAQYWSVVCPELKPYLPILYSLMHVPSGAEDKWATPRPCCGKSSGMLWILFDSNLNGPFDPVSTPPLRSYFPSVSCWLSPAWRVEAGWWEAMQH